MDAAPYTVTQNLRWFSVGYVLVLIAVVALVTVLDLAHINLPGGASTGANIGGFLGCVGAAGGRFAQKTNQAWTREDRAKLALGYVVAAIAISLFLASGLAVVSMILAPGALMEMIASMGVSQGAFIGFIAGAALFVGLMYYLGARLVLGTVAKRGASGAPT
jgi:hypothetical protein